MPKSKHHAILSEIQEKALAIGIGIVDAEKIDEVNIYEANKNCNDSSSIKIIC